jgi:hypothetical protein
MPYQNLRGGPVTEENREGQWIHIEVDPLALRADNPHNKIETIKAKLRRVLSHFNNNIGAVDGRILVIPDEAAFNEGEYDGTISRLAEARAQRGEEICITLPIQRPEGLLLTLWSELQKAQIPLMYRDLMYRKKTNGEKLRGPSGFPTPFSIVSFVSSEENLPVPTFEFTEAGLKTANIQFDPIEIARRNYKDFKAHRERAIGSLIADIEKIRNQPLYSEILHEDFKKRIGNYELIIEGAGRNSSPVLGIQKITEEHFKPLVDRYPLFYSNPSFSKFSEGRQIKSSLSQLDFDNSQEWERLWKQIEQAIGLLKHEYGGRIQEIKDNFANLSIDLSSYIPEYEAPSFVDGLIDRNPAQMQVILGRRIPLLEDEKQAHEEFKDRWRRWLIKNHENNKIFKNNRIYQHLAEFAEAIAGMEKKFREDPDDNILKSFKALYDKVEEKVLLYEGNIDETPYQVLINHFTHIARDINGDKCSSEEKEEVVTNLEKKIANEEPLSNEVKAFIYGVLFAIGGAIIGVVISGGLVSLPLAFTGFTFGQGLVLGAAVAFGGGLVGGSLASSVGFFGPNKKDRYEKEALVFRLEIKAIEAVFTPTTVPVR